MTIMSPKACKQRCLYVKKEKLLRNIPEEVSILQWLVKANELRLG